MYKKILTALIGLLFLPLASQANVKTYDVDMDHSIVSFRIGHLIGKVRGSFAEFSGQIKHDENNLKKFETEAKIDVSSINTNNEKRDNHLKSPDFFDIENEKTPQNKEILFTAKNFQVTEHNPEAGVAKGKLNGYITIKGVRQAISLDMSLNGNPVLDPFGNARISITASGSLKRQDFGLTWTHPAGEIVVGDIVEIELEIQGYRKVQAPSKKDRKKEKKS